MKRLLGLLTVSLISALGIVVSCSGGSGGAGNAIAAPLPNPTPTATEAFDTYLTAQMTSQMIPAMSVLIFNGDRVLHMAVLGKSDVEQDVDLTENDVFLLASVSKIVTGASLMKLVETDTINLNGNINDHLDFAVNIPNQSPEVTFKTLLTHTSAIDDGPALNDQYYDNQDSPVALADYMRDYFTPDAQYYSSENFKNYAPGSGYSYSNTGSALVGLLVQRLSGLDFKTYTQQNIFDPLGMSRTSWTLAGITSTIVRPYDIVNGTLQRLEHYTFTDYPNGGLRATASDLHKLLTAFVLEGVSNSTQILQAGTVTQMTTLQIPDLKDDVGLHLFLIDDTRNIWGHAGGEAGAETLVGFNPISNVGAIILTNRGEADLDEILTRAYDLGLTL